MIFTANDPCAHIAQIWDESGNNLCKKYFIKWYNTETQIAGVMDIVEGNGTKCLIPDGLGGYSISFVHFPGSKLVFVEPLKK